MEVSQSKVEAIMKGFAILHDRGFSGAADPMSSMLMDTIPASSMLEEYDFISAYPGIRELLGEVVIENLRTQGFTIRNKEFHSTIALKVAHVIADNLGLYSRNAENMGAAAKNHPDELLAKLLAAGFTTGTDYTGSAFFSSDKKAYDGATSFSNVTTGRLTAARYEAALANLKGRVNAKGRPMGLGKKLVLVVSPLYEAQARKILEAEKIDGGDTNVLRNSAQLVVWPQLSAEGMEHTWFLFEAGSVMKPFLHQQLMPWTQFSITDPKDSWVVTNKKFLWQVYGIHNVGYALPELAYGSDGTVV